MGASKLRASPTIEGPQAEIRRYLAPDGYKFWSEKVHVFSDEPMTLFKFKLKIDEKRQILTKFNKN
jgi:hypothetical protein